MLSAGHASRPAAPPIARIHVGTPLQEGLKYTYDWINSQVDAYVKEGHGVESLTQSKVVTQAMTDKCDMGNKGEGK